MEKIPAPGLRRTADGRRHSPPRERLLRAIESRGDASTAELVQALGLHENTVRQHLESLLRDGHVRREREPSTGRGRPAWRWHAVTAAHLSPYAGLASTLADALSMVSEDPFADARRAGTAWGRALAQERTTAHPGDAAAQALIVDVMREQGFAPESADQPAGATSESAGMTLRLRTCPLLTAATENRTVVCAVHEGMIEGIARTAGSDLTGRLEPFADAETCLLHLRTTA
ncbi:MAG: transcriptional regulator [Actinobacteria bacterium]|nr:transcriptional regulator [Actinomycetota bacterium]